MKAIKGIIITLIVIVALAGVTVIGGYVYVRSSFGIDLFKTVGQLKTLSQKVDESKLCPNAFSEGDMADMKDVFDQKASGLIVYEEGKGYNGYSVNLSASSLSPFTGNIGLSPKQTGALCQTIFYGQTGGKVILGGMELSASIVQTDFLNIDEDGSADFNVVVKAALKPIKDEMTGFPFGLLKKYMPDELYVSSTVRVDKTNNEMDYEISGLGLKVNNLSVEDTEDLFHTLDAAFKTGGAEDLNVLIGVTAVNGLIGNDENVGLVYSMKALGKKAFGFAEISGFKCLMVY